jgi:hypothetical protein
MVRWVIALCLVGCGTDDLGHAWTITAVSATIAPTKADGSPWDSDGTAPDPYVKMFIDDVAIATTAQLDDTLVPEWGYSPSPVVIGPDTKLSFELLDGDEFSADPIIVDCKTTTDGAQSCSSPQAMFMYTVTLE